MTSKGKKKLLRQYKVNKYNQLNEIPVPNLPDYPHYNTTYLKGHHPNAITGAYGFKPKTHRRRVKKLRRKKPPTPGENYNATVYYGQAERPRRQKAGDASFEKFKWKTYYKDSTLNPLHPKAIVEEFNYIKDS